jgi:hypothetical protein
MKVKKFEDYSSPEDYERHKIISRRLTEIDAKNALRDQVYFLERLKDVFSDMMTDANRDKLDKTVKDQVQYLQNIIDKL